MPAASRPGDVYAINAPYNGGTHLPDITVCTPVFDDAGRRHSVLGRKPGPSCRCRRHLARLDVAATRTRSRRKASISTISSWSIAAASASRRFTRLLNGAQYPARNPLQNVNDLKAQIAANEKGVQELRKMTAHFTLPVVKAYMGHVQDNAAESVRRVIDRLHDCRIRLRDGSGHGDPGEDLGRQGKRARRRWISPARRAQQPTNFNAPEPVTRAAVLYVFRVMVDDDIPMNAGCLRPINIIIPKRSMLSPEYPAAVVAGNVEVSQAVTDTLFGALGAHGGRAGHDEQSQFRQCPLSVLRDDLFGLAGGSQVFPAPMRCTRT